LILKDLVVTVAKKSLVIIGSARKESNTLRAVEAVFSSRLDYELCDLLDSDISEYSYEDDSNDDFSKIVEKMLSHEAIVFATPVYWYAMSGRMKVFFDRLTDLISKQKHSGRGLAGKCTYLIASGTDAQMPEGFEVPFARTSDYFSMRYGGAIYFKFHQSRFEGVSGPTSEFERQILQFPEFVFKRLTIADLELLHDWLNRPHVQEIWDGKVALAAMECKYKEHMQSNDVFGYLASVNGIPMAYAQTYHAHNMSGGWWPDAEFGTWGIDQFLANDADLGKGIGTKLVKSFADFVECQHRAKQIITDPAPDNIRAIRCYEKAGFAKLGMVRTPDGNAVLMRRRCIS
jgi:RimJ/RimL family protein N-acetyltransferase/putative NADPH-quinone reductase